MKKIMNVMELAEAVLARLFILLAACALLAVLLTGCDCGCGEEGTLKLLDNHGEYTEVCHGKYLPSAASARFKCDDGRTIWQPKNFIIDK